MGGSGHPEVESIRTSPVMEVELVGESFDITSFSPARQLVDPDAKWQFDIRARRHGAQRLILRIAMHVAGPDAASVMVAVPVLERVIEVEVDVPYSLRRFTSANWQWLAATILGLGGAVSAWLALLR
jgi:hypothetical protein